MSFVYRTTGPDLATEESTEFTTTAQSHNIPKTADTVSELVLDWFPSVVNKSSMKLSSHIPITEIVSLRHLSLVPVTKTGFYVKQGEEKIKDVKMFA
ncbi:Protein of unknown function [Pyronema omphalodes CBS 100304]|uniref:Uncharacterized protein n=1 Tax=Pyronema omphalodes (strain CBS 100304) TaxID=1076935 RepID=U4LU07_PYROM|nr:Protein of unknown function [Pyronema omphalodes CBS 100304]